MKKPLVSVLMLTYNQEQFIEQALESALSQKTNFPYEIVIGDDYSTDNTRTILKKYQKKFPNTIKLLFNKRNLKPTKNLMSVYKHCKGKYVALLEGDDYWTNPRKLQKQVDLLESHPRYTVCYHATAMINAAGTTLLELPLLQFRRSTATLQDLVTHESFMATCSTMFRNKLFGDFPQWFQELTFIADLPLNILNTQHGDIGYIDEVMSVYRTASTAQAFSAQPSKLVNLEGLIMFKGINHQLGYRYSSIISDKMARNYFALSKIFLEEKNLVEAKKFYQRYLSNKKTNRYVSLIDRTLFPLKLYTWEKFL